MLRNVFSAKRLVAAAGVAATLSAVPAVPAFAQPVVTGGLVNVTITNVLNHNQVAVQIPVNAAANVCGVAVNVLTSQLNNVGTATCTARSGHQTLTINPLS